MNRSAWWDSRLVKLSRTVANELTVLALLVSLAVSDLRSEASDFIYATDASLAKGAICRAHQCGFCSLLMVYLQIKRCLPSPHDSLADDLQKAYLRSWVPRPVAFCYDFLVFSGASTVSRALSALGFVVGPPIDLSISEEYNMEWV